MRDGNINRSTWIIPVTFSFYDHHLTYRNDRSERHVPSERWQSRQCIDSFCWRIRVLSGNVCTCILSIDWIENVNSPKTPNFTFHNIKKKDKYWYSPDSKKFKSKYCTFWISFVVNYFNDVYFLRSMPITSRRSFGTKPSEWAVTAWPLHQIILRANSFSQWWRSRTLTVGPMDRKSYFS